MSSYSIRITYDYLAREQLIKPLIKPVSEPLSLEAERPPSNSDILPEVPIRAISTPQTQIGVETDDSQPPLDKSPKPPITSSSPLRTSSQDLVSGLETSVEADPAYQVSVEQVLDENKPHKDSVEISIYNPNPATFQGAGCAFRRGSLQSQNSCDSLQTVITHDDRIPSPIISETLERDLTLFKDLPEIIEEDWVSEDVEGNQKPENQKEATLSKTYESLFGGPSGGPPRERAISDIFVNKQDPPASIQQGFKLPQKGLDSPFSYLDKPSTELPTSTDNLNSKTNPTNPISSNLPAITERKSEDGTKHNTSQSASTERGFISAEDLIARLAVQPAQPARKLTPIPDQSIVNPKVRFPSDKKMDFLKRGERRRPAPPSLRRAGSQIESSNASSEHIIFGGERYQTPENNGKGKKADIYVCSCFIVS